MTTKRRVCACGCGRSLEGRPINQVWHVNINCQRHRQAVARAKINDARRPGYKSREGTAKVNQRIPAEPPREPVILCKSCYGVKDARSPYRRDSRGNPIGVRIMGRWRCRECNEPHRDPKPIRARATIGSSGGTCADHGKMYGFAGNEHLGIE